MSTTANNHKPFVFQFYNQSLIIPERINSPISRIFASVPESPFSNAVVCSHSPAVWIRLFEIGKALFDFMGTAHASIKIPSLNAGIMTRCLIAGIFVRRSRKALG
jgi:hypothetical protein